MLVTIIALIIVATLMYKFGKTISQAVVSTAADPDTTIAKSASPGDKVNTQQIFFKTVFTLLGYIAKIDGRVNKTEIRIAEEYMEKMELTAEQRRTAIQLFKDGTRLCREGESAPLNLKKILDDFQILTKKNSDQTEILLVYMINMARMDGLLVEKEVDIIHEVAKELGFSSIAFNHLLQMISSQYKFSDHTPDRENHTNSTNSNHHKNHQNKKEDASKKNEQDKNADTVKTDPDLLAAYHALGISMTASDSEIKKAYRKLVNQHHPDKLEGQDLPEFMVKAAAENFRRIQAAYLYIKKSKAKV